MNENNFILPTLIMLIALMGIIIYTVIRGARKTRNIEDYALGNFAFSPVAVGLALAASMTSAATFIINPGLIGLYGISGVIAYAIVLPIAAFASLILLTKSFRKHGTRVKALTMAQWMSEVFNKKFYGSFFAILSLLLLSFIVLIVVGLAQLIAKPLDISPIIAMICIVIFVFGYMMFGGANSLIYTNTIQAFLMIIVALILLGSGGEFFNQGLSGFISQLHDINPKLTQSTYAGSLLFRDYFEIIFCQFIIGIAIVCQPHILTKSLMLKEDRLVNIFLLTGIITMLVFFSVVIVGLYARLTFPEMSFSGEAIKPDQLVPTYIIHRFDVAMLLLVTLGLIAAGISTLEGLIQSISVTISSDLIIKNSNRLINASPKTKIILNRIVIVLMAIVSIILSVEQIKNPDLSVAIFAQNGVYAFFSAAFFPLIMGMFLNSKDVKIAFIVSLSALLIHFGMYYGKVGPYMQNTINNPAISAAMAILGSTILGSILLIVSRIRNKYSTQINQTL